MSTTNLLDFALTEFTPLTSSQHFLGVIFYRVFQSEDEKPRAPGGLHSPNFRTGIHEAFRFSEYHAGNEFEASPGSVIVGED